MNFLGLNITRQKAPVAALSRTDVYGSTGDTSFLGLVRESFAGAWQKNVTVDCQESILAFSAVYACVTLIADDISKLRIKLTKERVDGTWEEITKQSPFLAVLTKPNRYQTRIQFIKEWVTMKLIHGNAYILKERDLRGVVVALYVLDSRRVKPLVSTDGSVYYQLTRNDLAGVGDDQPIIPADEIIHDRMITLWHPLIGVTPIYACGAAATQGARIQANSAKFFENMSRPSGQLTAPGKISDETAQRLKNLFEANFSAGNIGRLFVGGDGLTYQPMSMPANDAQLIEQLRWTVEDVGRCFKVPLHKISSGHNPTFNNVGSLNQDYYSQCLQAHIEGIELLLDEALGLPANSYGTELDLEGLLRMDPVSRADANEKRIRAGYLTPNEARATDNLPPVEGGNSPFLQQQNWPLEQLASRPDSALTAAKPAGGGGADKPPAADDSGTGNPAAETPTPPGPPPPTKSDAEAFTRALLVKFMEQEIA